MTRDETRCRPEPAFYLARTNEKLNHKLVIVGGSYKIGPNIAVSRHRTTRRIISAITPMFPTTFLTFRLGVQWVNRYALPLYFLNGKGCPDDGQSLNAIPAGNHLYTPSSSPRMTSTGPFQRLHVRFRISIVTTAL